MKLKKWYIANKNYEFSNNIRKYFKLIKIKAKAI